MLRVGLQEEVERIEDRHFGNQIDFHRELRGWLREDQAREIVALRVLLPVDEVVLGKNFQRIGEDRRAAVRGGAQPDDLRSERYPPVVPVAGLMVKRNVNGHVICG